LPCYGRGGERGREDWEFWMRDDIPWYRREKKKRILTAYTTGGRLVRLGEKKERGEEKAETPPR